MPDVIALPEGGSHTEENETRIELLETWSDLLDEYLLRQKAGIFNALDYDVDPTGVSDSSAGILEACADAMENGGVVSLAGKTFRMSASLELEEPITIDGGGYYENADNNVLYGGGLNFDTGVAGIIVQGRGSRLANMFVTSDTNFFGAPALSGSETDDGIKIEAPYVMIDRVAVRHFGRHGLNATSGGGINANLGHATYLDASFNGKNGIRLSGTDSNMWQFDHPNVVANEEEGIFNLGLKNTFNTPHGEANDGDAASSYDFNDGGAASVWINPYSEAGHRFLINTPEATCFAGMILSGGTAGMPVVWSGAGPSEGVFAAVQSGWFIQFGGIIQNRVTIKDTAVGAHEMAIYGDWSPEAIVFGDRTSALSLLSLFGSAGNPRVVVNQRLVLDDGKNITFDTTTGTKIGTSATEKLAFYNATPIVRPTGVAVDAASIHAALVSLGLIGA